MEGKNKESPVEEKQLFHESFTKVRDELAAQNLLKEVEVIAKTSCVISKRYQSSWMYEEMRQLVCDGSIKSKIELEKFAKGIQEDAEKSGNKGVHSLREFQFRFKVGLGQLFPSIANLEEIFQNNESFTLTHPKNKVMLVDFWSVAHPPSFAQLQHRSELLTKNASAWKDDVHFVAISIDLQKEPVISKIVEKGWRNMQHLRAHGWGKEHELVKLFEVSGLPFGVLIDRSGRIHYIGHPGRIELQAKITELLGIKAEDCEAIYAAGKQKQEEEFAKRSLISKEQYAETQVFLQKEFLELVTSKFPKFKGRFGIIMLKEKVVKDGVLAKEYYKPVIDFIIDKNDHSQTKELLEALCAKFGKDRFLVGIQDISDSKGSIITHMKDLCVILNELQVKKFRFGLRKDIILTMNKNKQIVKQKGEELCQYGVMSPGDITADQLQKVRARFRFYGDQLFKQRVNFDVVKNLLATGVQISLKGTKFLEMAEMRKLGETKTSQVVHTQGEVLIVDFFLQKFIPSVEKTDQYLKAIKANLEAWKGKVRFVAVCLEPENEKTLELHKSHAWGEHMDFYFFNQDLRFRNEFMHYRISNMPHVCVVDKFGAINYNGEATHVNIEKRVNELIAATSATVSEPTSGLSVKDAAEQYHSVKALLRNSSDDAAFAPLKALSYDPRLIIKITRERVFDSDGKVVDKVYRQCEIGFGLKSEDAHVAEEFFKVHGNRKSFNVKIESLDNE